MTQSFLDREGILILLVAVLSLALLSAAGYFLWHPPEEASQTSDSQAVTAAVPDTLSKTQIPLARDPSTVPEVRYPGEDGRTVLDLLKQDHRVHLDSELLLFGSIVLAIDSFTAGPDDYWIYYRDSLRGDRSPEVCTTRAGETIRWVLRSRK